MSGMQWYNATRSSFLTPRVAQCDRRATMGRRAYSGYLRVGVLGMARSFSSLLALAGEVRPGEKSVRLFGGSLWDWRVTRLVQVRFRYKRLVDSRILSAVNFALSSADEKSTGYETSRAPGRATRKLWWANYRCMVQTVSTGAYRERPVALAR